MRKMMKLEKLQKGDKVAVLSPSFAAPALYPHVFELGLERIREVFELQPVEYPTTRKLGASADERAIDLVAAFENPEIKGVIATIGGDDQVTYIHTLAHNVFVENPKPFLDIVTTLIFAIFFFNKASPHITERV